MENKKLWYGVPGIKMIYHGDWADPELKYKGKLFNYYGIKNSLWEFYKEDLEEKLFELINEENIDDGFERWITNNHETVYEYLK